MAKARILAPWVGEGTKSAIYHCVSRVVERQFHFGAVEKEQFVKLMRIYEAFCGVKVLSFCILSNHIHIVVEVPPRPKGGISDDEILERLALVQQPESVAAVRELFESYQGEDVTEKGKSAHEALREKYLSRMWDLGKFMKYLKQRFSRWFNIVHQRKGTLWEERYNSSLIEGGYAALVVSAYVDLNPVRAGIVTDPKDYRWSSYAEAVAGGRLAREGIASILHAKDLSECPVEVRDEGDLDGYKWRSVAVRYRSFLYEEGYSPDQSPQEQGQEVKVSKRSQRKGFTQEQVDEEVQRGGELSVAAQLRCRTRSFIDGAVIGSRGFVEGVISELNQQKYWHKPRKAGGSRIKITDRAKAKSKITNHSKRVDERGREGGVSFNSNAASKPVVNDELWSLRHLKKE